MRHTIWLLRLCLLSLASACGAVDAWSTRTNIALAFDGAEAVIEQADGTTQPAPKLIDGNRDDDSITTIKTLPKDVVISLPRLTSVAAIRIFPGLVGNAGNPSGECGIRSYALHGWVNGGWLPLIETVTNAPTVLESPVAQTMFCYTHTFPPRSIEKVRLRILQSSDTGCRVNSPKLSVVPVPERVSTLREIEVFTADEAGLPSQHISKLLEGDFRLPVWLNLKQAQLWLYPLKTLSRPLNLEIAFKARATESIPCAPIHVKITPADKPLKVNVNITDWPSDDYLTTIRIMPADQAPSGELQRLLRVQTIPEPAKPGGATAVKGLTLPMVDDWYIETRTGALRHQIHPAELIPVTTGPLAPDRVLQGGGRCSVKPDGTFVVIFWDKKRDGTDMRWHIATSTNLSDWVIQEQIKTSSIPKEPSYPRSRQLAHYLPTRPLLAASITGKLPLAATPPAQPLIVSNTPPTENYRFYVAERDGPINLEQVNMKWVGLKDTFLGDIPAVARSAWPIWHKSATERLVLKHEPLIIDKPEYQAGELDTWRDTNDNFGGQWLNRDRTRLHYCRTRTVVRFPPFRIPYDNMWQVNRILAVWSTTNGLDWQTTWFSQPTLDESIGMQHYGVNTSAHEDGHLRMGYVFNYDQVTQQIWLELNTSRDGLLWKRSPNHVPIATNGPLGSWNFGMLFVDGREVAHGDYMYLTINNCFSGVHFYDLSKPPETTTAATLERRYATRGLAEQWPFFAEIGGWEGLAQAMRTASKTTGLMRMRRDGWSSLRADGTAIATTRLLQADATLALNARTDKGGAILVEILDADNKPLPDYCGTNAARFEGDSTRYPLTWRKGQVKTLPASAFKLRMTLKSADCFALYF